jgi:hypothetical protein
MTAQQDSTLARDLDLIDPPRKVLKALVKRRDPRTKAIVAAKGFGSEGCAHPPHAPFALGVIQRDQRLDV